MILLLVIKLMHICCRICVVHSVHLLQVNTIRDLSKLLDTKLTFLPDLENIIRRFLYIWVLLLGMERYSTLMLLKYCSIKTYSQYNRILQFRQAPPLFEPHVGATVQRCFFVKYFCSTQHTRCGRPESCGHTLMGLYISKGYSLQREGIHWI